ncbi:hypothetical protein J2Z50_003104 [Ensifer mexicanus]|nr:hypothetical protein [Sinorhizobium mexicanum]
MPRAVALIVPNPRGQGVSGPANVSAVGASNFHRMHTLISSVGAALGLADEQIDAMWSAATNLELSCAACDLARPWRFAVDPEPAGLRIRLAHELFEIFLIQCSRRSACVAFESLGVL